MSSPPSLNHRNARNAVIAGFLGWTLDAFDFFLLVMTIEAVARDFHRPIPAIALTLTASLATRPVGALLFGMMADRFGRRLPLMLVILFYSVMEVLSGLAPTYAWFFAFRLLYGVGMGGEWGVGASLTMESVPERWRGFVSGLLQEGYAFGYLLAAVAYYTVFPRWGWRPMFFLGGLPALLSLFVFSQVQESESWKQSRADWRTYRRAFASNFKLFLYLVLLMACMNSISHGTQDLYPTFLRLQRHFTVHQTAAITIVAMLGAMAGGMAFGALSERRGRRRAMVLAVVLAALLVPVWLGMPTVALVAAGAFAMQFMVQGAWGVIPAHINELSPDELRGFFPGFAYQMGVLCASGVAYFQSVAAQRFGYLPALASSMVFLLVAGAFVIGFGPERRGIVFGNRTARPLAKTL
ncbi:MAG TPA: MFS transporter [Terriglobales bacterium]|nr:MFS transporter [Terriglobales bacterium]